MKIRVKNMTSPRSLREVTNQFIIFTNKGRYFQSYRSIIAFVPYGEGKTILDEKFWNWSRTTSKYRNKFLGEYTEETRQKITDGVYELANLNT